MLGSSEGRAMHAAAAGMEGGTPETPATPRSAKTSEGQCRKGKTKKIYPAGQCETAQQNTEGEKNFSDIFN